MGRKKKYGKLAQHSQEDKQETKLSIEEKRFVNLLHSYTIYKQRLRKLSKEEFEEMLCHGNTGKEAVFKLCRELMKAKQVSDVEPASFDENVGFLSAPRLMPLLALLGERAGYNIKPSLVNNITFSGTPSRFQEKFVPLLVYGYWFLGRVITDSLSVENQINRGNMFSFAKGDLGFWWAGVKILDWINQIFKANNPISNCHSFVKLDPPKYRLYSDRGILNMNKHPLYFLSATDWKLFIETIKGVRCRYKVNKTITILTDNEIALLTTIENLTSEGSTNCTNDGSEISVSSELSVNAWASKRVC